jgi:hypothetical protein
MTNPTYVHINLKPKNLVGTRLQLGETWFRDWCYHGFDGYYHGFV